MIIVDQSKCVGCGKCEKMCPEGAIKVIDKKAVLDHSLCINCGRCVQNCPTKALSMSSRTTPASIPPGRCGKCQGRGRKRGWNKGRCRW